MFGPYRKMYTSFWTEPLVLEEMTPEDKLFYIYLKTNPHTTQIGIYKIIKKQMAFELGYSDETVNSLMKRFIEHFQLIRYNPETRELAIKDWGRMNLNIGGKPVMDCICSELKEVIDTSLIEYVSQSIPKKEIQLAFQSFCDQGENDTYIDGEGVAFDDSSTMRGQEKEKEEKEIVKKEMFQTTTSQNPLQDRDTREIVEFWDNNGFGFGNVFAKGQLVAWLDDSKFLKPKEMILHAMKLACANNKKSLNYIVTILKNWEAQSLLTLEEVEYQENSRKKNNKTTEPTRVGRDIPRSFVLDLTAGEES